MASQTNKANLLTLLRWKVASRFCRDVRKIDSGGPTYENQAPAVQQSVGTVCAACPKFQSDNLQPLGIQFVRALNLALTREKAICMRLRSLLRFVFVAWLAAIAFAPHALWAAPPLKGHHDRVNVSAETRLDWVFAVANQSRETPPDDWLPGYDSIQPAIRSLRATDYNPRKSYSVVLFISAIAAPDGLEPMASRSVSSRM